MYAVRHAEAMFLCLAVAYATKPPCAAAHATLLITTDIAKTMKQVAETKLLTVVVLRLFQLPFQVLDLLL